MYIRATRLEDLPRVMTIYAKAKAFMHSHGNLNQWVNGYPSEELIKEEIRLHHSFVCLNEASEIVGTFCFIVGEDPTYRQIDGHWLNNDVYGTIHRIASSGKEKGIFKSCVDWCINQCSNLRIDTHQDNVVMQSVILKNGFRKCGIIHLQDGSPRIAFQLVKVNYTKEKQPD